MFSARYEAPGTGRKASASVIPEGSALTGLPEGHLGGTQGRGNRCDRIPLLHILGSDVLLLQETGRQANVELWRTSRMQCAIGFALPRTYAHTVLIHVLKVGSEWVGALAGVGK